MPKVDSQTRQPMTDKPGMDPEASGGKRHGDPGMEDATPQGTPSRFKRYTPSDTSSLVGEKRARGEGY